MYLKNKKIDFEETISAEGVLFIDYLKVNYKYEGNIKTDELDSFTIRCFSVSQKDCFDLKVRNLDKLEEVKEYRMFEKLFILNGEVTQFNNKYYFKCTGVSSYDK